MTYAQNITRWHSLTLSPADRAILDQMEEEMDDDEQKELSVRVSAAHQREAETGWLVELVSRLGLPPTWFALGGDDGEGYFTADSVKALRFARKEDAQAYINDIGWTECVPTEHQWG